MKAISGKSGIGVGTHSPKMVDFLFLAAGKNDNLFCNKVSGWQKLFFPNIFSVFVAVLFANSFVASAQVAGSVASQGFIARGTIVAYTKMGSPDSNTPRKIAEADFTAIVDTKSNTYSISISQPPVTENAEFHGVLQVASDGVDHYVLKQVISTNHAVVATSAEVGKGLFPYRAEEFHQVIWLLCVLDHLPLTNRTGLIQASRQLKFLSINNIPFEVYETELHPFSNDISSIQCIRYYHPGFEVGPDGKKVKYDPPNDKGFITASFEKGEIAFPELGLPRNAVFTTYLQTHFITNRDDVPPFAWDNVSVISCERYSGTAYLLPPITTGTHIDDYRFSDELQGRPIGYACENNLWVLRSNEKLQTIYKHLKGVVPVKPLPKGLSQYWILAVLLLLAVLPPVYLLIKRLRAKTCDQPRTPPGKENP